MLVNGSLVLTPKLLSDSAADTAGEPGKDKKKVWVIARQHPGESMAGTCSAPTDHRDHLRPAQPYIT